jgi:hypothetical protein
MTTDDAKRRSEARERRRAAAADENGRSDGDGASSGGGLESAARAAAAAAAVGAALGAVKALAQRDDHDDEPQNDAEPDDRGTTSVADEPTDEDDQDDPDETDEQRQPAVGAESDEEPQQQRSDERDESRPREGASAGTVRSIAARAREQLQELQGRDAESITALERTREGWRVTCEVLEVERIPNSTDVLATYVIELDGDGELIAFERVRRYYRAQAGGEQ